MISAALIEALSRAPNNQQRGRHNGADFSAEIAIADYRTRIEKHYAEALPSGLSAACEQFEIPLEFRHFGLIVTFDKPIELHLFDEGKILGAEFRAAIDVFGPVIVRNVRIPAALNTDFHRNIFTDLRFHVDRGSKQPNQISMYNRDCADPVQREPRTSSTVFVANIVAHLQHLREANGGADMSRKGVKVSYDIFRDCRLAGLIGEVVLEQPWTAPTSVGEIAAIDNRTVLHASYYRDGKNPGYPISTRYLV